MKIKIRKNKYFLFTILILFCLTIYSFFYYFQENFSYVTKYYEVIQKCGSKGTAPNDDVCSLIKNDKQLEDMKKNDDPKKK